MKHFTRVLAFVAVGLGIASTVYAPETSTFGKAKLLAKGTACSARCGIGPRNYSKMLNGDIKGLKNEQINCMKKCLN